MKEPVRENFRTGLEDLFVTVNHKQLRCGYTTGSCAAGAAKAAAWMLLSGIDVEEIALMTPKGILLHLAVEDISRSAGKTSEQSGDSVTCAIRKDGGDDIDETDGILVYATVSRSSEPGVHIDGGRGVGRVTKPGLNQPVGNAAINSTPREMITASVQEVCRELGWEGGMDVLISIPRGEEVAARTFNPRLGIVGGISVLGTSGIVMPMSETALVDSLRAEMRMLRANGGEYLVITPGNYGETFSREMGSLDLTYEMKCSNFVGETMDMAESLGVKGILFIAHIGKFVKVSGGIMNTHSHNADSRAELTAAAAVRAGAELPLVRRILETNTTEDALDILAEGGQELYSRAMQEICDRAVFYLQARCRGKVQTELVIFSSVRGKLAESAGVPEMIRKINEQGAAREAEEKG